MDSTTTDSNSTSIFIISVVVFLIDLKCDYGRLAHRAVSSLSESDHSGTEEQSDVRKDDILSIPFHLLRVFAPFQFIIFFLA